MKLSLKENGPLVVEIAGTYKLSQDGQEEVLEKPKVSLCRCGASSKKPFCDGSHKQVDFSAPAGELELL